MTDIREGDVGAILGWGFMPWSSGSFSLARHSGPRAPTGDRRRPGRRPRPALRRPEAAARPRRDRRELLRPLPARRTGGLSARGHGPRRGVPPPAWWKVATIIAAIFLAAWLADSLFGRAATAGAIGGSMLGLIGSMFGDLRRSVLAAVTALVGLVVAVHAPFWVGIAVVVPALAALVAADAARNGSRGFVLALFGWIICFGPAAAVSERDVLTAFAAASAAGIALAWRSASTGTCPAGPADAATGSRCSSSLGRACYDGDAGRPPRRPAQQLDRADVRDARADAPRRPCAGHRRFGVGSVVGSLAAAVIEYLHVPDQVLFALAPLILVGGVRFLGAPSALAPGLLTAGVLFSVAPTVHSAEFRIGAAVLVALLAETFAWLVDRPIQAAAARQATGT